MKRRIDATCDRFELAWAALERPRIEEYLAEAPSDAKALLLRELLVSELALRRERGEDFALDEYVRRFVDNSDIVAEVFQSDAKRATAGPHSAPVGPVCLEIVRAFRRRHRPAAAGNESGAPSSDLEAAIAMYAGEPPSKLSAPVERSLWLWILYVCALQNRLNSPTVESLIDELLKSLSPLRQAILTEALLGASIPEITEAMQVTERTAVKTFSIAIALVANSL